MGRAVPGHGPVVLVVEDEGLIRANAENFVEAAGYQVLSAANADEAIAILESRNDVRAVFTDIQMPGSIDGLKLARIVRDRWPPVALIVTSGKVDILETDLPAGGKFLRKPYALEQVQNALRDLLC